MSEEKDRFGDDLRRKEKAEEDRYFAEQDRARLEKLRQSASQAGPLGLCPRCGIALAKAHHHQVAVDRCTKCGGIWLDQGELEAIGEREDGGWATRWLRSLLPNQTKR